MLIALIMVAIAIFKVYSTTSNTRHKLSTKKNTANSDNTLIASPSQGCGSHPYRWVVRASAAVVGVPELLQDLYKGSLGV